LSTALDARIPFVADTAWVYLSLFPTACLPLFVVRCPRLFRRTMAAYVAAMAASFVAFAVYPVASTGLRADPAVLDVQRFAPWAVSLLYRLDPPYNLFPSLHLSIALIASFAAWKASRRVGAVAFAGVVLIGVSICTVKQHFVADAFGGIGLAAGVYALVLRRYRPTGGVSPAFGWRGPAAYAGLLVLSYAALYAAFAMGGAGMIPSRTMKRTKCATVSASVGSGRPPEAWLLATRYPLLS